MKNWMFTLTQSSDRRVFRHAFAGAGSTGHWRSVKAGGKTARAAVSYATFFALRPAWTFPRRAAFRQAERRIDSRSASSAAIFSVHYGQCIAAEDQCPAYSVRDGTHTRMQLIVYPIRQMRTRRISSEFGGCQGCNLLPRKSDFQHFAHLPVIGREITCPV